MKGFPAWVSVVLWANVGCSSGPTEVEARCDSYCQLTQRGSSCDVVGIAEYCGDGHCACVTACSEQTIEEMPVGRTCPSQLDDWNHCARQRDVSCSAATLDACTQEAAALKDCHDWSGS